MGSPLVTISYEHETRSAPYLVCTVLNPYQDSESGLPADHIEYMEALMHDVRAASSDSRGAALVMLNRLEAIAYGPIRCPALHSSDNQIT